MNVPNKIAVVLSATLALSACRDAPPPPPPADAPKIVAFTASSNQINPGGQVTLTYQVEGANALELTDDAGAFIPLNGDVNTGTATVTPVQSRFYVLRATGRGGRTAAFVQVAVGAPVKDVFLIAVPPDIDGGESALLLWGAPRSSSATITSSAGDSFPLTGDSGSFSVTPARTTTYTLVADPGTGAAKVSSAVEVRVAPVIATFTANPAAARAGEKLALSWTSFGGTRVSLSEGTFGSLFSADDAVVATTGTFEFQVPAMLPNGAPVQDGLPLQFSLRVEGSTPDAVATQAFAGYVGAAPVIASFTAPAYVTRDLPFNVSWVTSGASSITIRENGLAVYQSVAAEPDRLDTGTAQLPALKHIGNYTYELVATNPLGISTTDTVSITVIDLPVITSFTMPSSIGSPGGTANAAWTTQNANRVSLRTSGGTNVFSSAAAGTVVAGNVDIGLGQTTTLTLEAANEAGDVATAEQTTLVPSGGFLSVDAGTSLPDLPITLSYALDSLGAQKIVGVPGAGVVASGATFVDIKAQPGAQQLTFDSTTDGVASFTPGNAFRFPFFGRPYSSFHVQVDGILGLTRQNATGANNTNVAVASLGDALLPFWDTLELGAGAVHWQLEDSGYPRTLTVQWSNVQITGVAGTDLTFQVQLEETGEFRFVYGTLIGTGAGAETATIGVQAQSNAWSSQAPSNNGMSNVSAGSEITWFVAQSATGSFTSTFAESGRFTLLALNNTGAWVLVDTAVKVFAPNSIEVSELMPVPQTGVPLGQYVELYNATSRPLDIGGLVLKTQASLAGGFILPELTLAAGDTVLFGQSTTLSETDEAPVEYVFNDVPLSSDNGTVTLSTGNGDISRVAYGAAPPPGRAIYAPQPFAFRGDGGTAGTVPATCPPTQAFNSAGTSFGSPGQVNEPCLSYRVEAIPGAFEDILNTGTNPFTSTLEDQGIAVTLPTPIKYFGTDYNAVNVTTSGYLKFGTASRVSDSRGHLSATATAQGALAPYWDHLHYPNAVHGPGGVRSQRVAQGPGVPVGYYIFSWHNMIVAKQFHVETDNLVNVQTKVFDDGVIEFHYGQLINEAAQPTAFGNTASAWLEQPGQATGLIISRKAPNLRPFTAYRFTPIP